MIAERIFSVFRSLHCKFVTMIILCCFSLKRVFQKESGGLENSLVQSSSTKRFSCWASNFSRLLQESQVHEASY